LLGCNNYTYEEVDNRLTDFDLSQLFFTATAESKTIVVAPGSDEQISTHSNSAWCTAVVSGRSVAISVDTNYDFPNRTAILTITCGKKSAMVPVTQYGARFILGTNNLSADFKSATYKIAVQSTRTYTAVSTVPWITVSTGRDTLFLTVERNPYQEPVRTGIVEVTSGVVVQTINVSQAEGGLVYEDFLGTYTMSYTNATTLPPNRTRNLTVNLEPATQGQTYYLKGVLATADEDLGNIVVRYNPVKGIEIVGHLLFVRPDNNFDCHWLVFGLNNTGGLVSSLANNTLIGLESSGISFSTGNLTFTMVDNGIWGANQAIGFRARNYVGSTSQGDVPGRDGQVSYFFPLFEKQ
jgi:hypothetical protein